jgi:hypothetical protein
MSRFSSPTLALALRSPALAWVVPSLHPGLLSASFLPSVLVLHLPTKWGLERPGRASQCRTSRPERSEKWKKREREWRCLGKENARRKNE